MCVRGVHVMQPCCGSCCLFQYNWFVAEDCHNVSTPLKSGIRIYRRLAADTNGSSLPICSRRRARFSAREINALREVVDGRVDAVNGLKTAGNGAKQENSGSVHLRADDDKVGDRETVSMWQWCNILNCMMQRQHIVIKTNY